MQASSRALSILPLGLWHQIMIRHGVSPLLDNNESQTVANSLLVQIGLKEKPQRYFQPLKEKP